MLNFKQILIPVDFSDNSRRMLTQLSNWFSGADGQVFYFVHVWQAPALGYESHVLVSLRDKLSNLAEGFTPTGDFQKEIEILEGHPATSICGFAKSNSCDLIALATHGRSGMKHLLIGSTAENIVRYAPCPVLTTHLT